MSNLYIRVMTGFYTHRKTARLRSLIGDAAFWVPPRLWAYCAENQPDGDLSGYGDAELEMLIGYASNATSNATSMMQALIQSSYVDTDWKVHDWQEHNGYHKTFSDRAKTAAAARWEKVEAIKLAKAAKEKPPTPPKEQEKQEIEIDSGDKHCLKHATSMTPINYYEQIDARAGALFGRTTPANAYAEQSAISEISRRLDALGELAEIEAFHRKPGNFFPQSLSKLLSAWQETLDRARTHDKRKQNHATDNRTGEKRIDRSIGTANEGIANQYKEFADRKAGRVGAVAKAQNV
jgi:hypothetical protein